MRTETLRARILEGATTIKGAKVWPNGLGFTAYGTEYSICENREGTPWIARTRTDRIGYGASPRLARAHAYDDGDSTICEECQATIPAVASTLINRWHLTTCSLHPTNVQESSCADD